MDLRGILGLSKEVRNGFSAIRVGFTIKGDAPDDEAAGDRPAGMRPLRRARHPEQRHPDLSRNKHLNDTA